jgi:hypothetical protein
MLAAPLDGIILEGLSGETGRANKDFWGEKGRIGERGSVRELADRGESTWDDCILEVVLVGGKGA